MPRLDITNTGDIHELVGRNLRQSARRTILSALAIALGVAMTVAASVTSQSLLNSLAGSEDAQTLMVGLLDQLASALTMIGVMITLSAGFLVFNAFAMSITQRRLGFPHAVFCANSRLKF